MTKKLLPRKSGVKTTAVMILPQRGGCLGQRGPVQGIWASLNLKHGILKLSHDLMEEATFLQPEDSLVGIEFDVGKKTLRLVKHEPGFRITRRRKGAEVKSYLITAKGLKGVRLQQGLVAGRFTARVLKESVIIELTKPWE